MNALHYLTLLISLSLAELTERGSRPQNISLNNSHDYDDELDVFAAVTNIVESFVEPNNPPAQLTNIVNIHVTKDRNSSEISHTNSTLHNVQPSIVTFGCRLQKVQWISFGLTIFSIALQLFAIFILFGVSRVLPNHLRCYFPAAENLHSQRESRI